MTTESPGGQVKLPHPCSQVCKFFHLTVDGPSSGDSRHRQWPVPEKCETETEDTRELPVEKNKKQFSEYIRVRLSEFGF